MTLECSSAGTIPGMATQLNYTQEQFRAMFKEVAESYQKDEGSEILEMAFRKD